MGDVKFDSFMGHGPKQIAHWEHWSCPDAETYLTGIDYYDHPKLCRGKMNLLYPQLSFGVPDTDEPKPRPRLDAGESSADLKNFTVRWGDGETCPWKHGETIFKSADDVFAFSPLKKADFRDWPHVHMALDYTSEEAVYRYYRKMFPDAWGDAAPEGNSAAAVGFYNTMFMWPILTFGWELFLECCLDPRFERIMDEFAEINRRVFRAFARLPVNFAVCHDDIVTTRGPVCSPAWMRKYIFPRYEEFWGILKSHGKEVIFMVDGCVDAFVDDVMACGARGIISEPYTDYKAIVRRYKNCFIAGEGDNRILMRNKGDEIDAMVKSMVATGRMSCGYMMCIGNHIPWNVPPAAVKRYLDRSAEWGQR